jgi:hypothetical protein
LVSGNCLFHREVESLAFKAHCIARQTNPSTI